jgi:hypothetical protein
MGQTKGEAASGFLPAFWWYRQVPGTELSQNSQVAGLQS